jgi:AraC family transcriptional activator of pobA
MASDNHLNISDFHSLYLADANESVCEFKPLHVNDGSGFFEISTLEGLQDLHNKVRHKEVRRSFYTVIFLIEGEIKESLNHSRFTVKPGSVYFIPENALSTTHHWSADVKGYHLIFDADFFLLCEKNQTRLNSYPFFSEEFRPFIQLTPAERSSAQSLLNHIAVEFCKSKISQSDSLVKLYLNALLIEFERDYKHSGETFHIHQSRKKQISTAFKKLISQHAGKLKQVSEFAELLHITPHYLNDVIKEHTGYSASWLIQLQIVSLAKSYLVQTSLTVAEISTILHYPDHSYFIRLFKKHTSCTPLKFRRDQKS